MVAPGRRMVLNAEHPIPETTLPSKTTTLAGQMDYSVVMAEEEQASERGGDRPFRLRFTSCRGPHPR